MTSADEPKKRASRGKITRDLLLFLIGLGGVVHEVFFSTTDRPFLLILLGSLVGLPAMIRLDEFRKSGDLHV